MSLDKNLCTVICIERKVTYSGEGRQLNCVCPNHLSKPNHNTSRVEGKEQCSIV